MCEFRLGNNGFIDGFRMDLYHDMSIHNGFQTKLLGLLAGDNFGEEFATIGKGPGARPVPVAWAHCAGPWPGPMAQAHRLIGPMSAGSHGSNFSLLLHKRRNFLPNPARPPNTQE